MMINDSKPYELLGEINKLLKKYGKDTFSELADILKDSKLLNNLIDIFENTPKFFPKKKRTQKRPSALEERMSFRESLVSLEKAEPEKAMIILSLFDLLQTKAILPSLRDLTNFISNQGLPVPKGKSRDRIIISFIKRCTKFPLHDLQALASTINLQQYKEDTDRSLAEWGKVILSRKKDKS